MDGNSSNGENSGNSNISWVRDDKNLSLSLSLGTGFSIRNCNVNAGSGKASKTSPEMHLDRWNDEDFPDDLSDVDSWFGSDSDISVPINSSSEDKISALESMGFALDEALIAIDRCPEASISQLIEYITAVQVGNTDGVSFQELSGESKKPTNPDRKSKRELKDLAESNQTIPFPKEMLGFGVPTKEGSLVIHRNLPELATRPPYFYYENVVLAPAGVWDTISRFLCDVQPEFVDSKYFSAATRKRGYVHNLPIDKRFPLVPLPPQTIQEAFPFTKRWWPSWDTRTKLNCFTTCTESAKVIERITKALNNYETEPPESVKRYVIKECKKWNLIWVGKNMVAPLECGEMETLLGFPMNHTRGAGTDRICRYTSLGNSFQVDTVAYHLSVLRDLFPGGINVLSLFSGIGGAEVALHRLGIPLKNVVSVEISEVNRLIMERWWEQTNQKGKLIQVAHIWEVNHNKLDQWITSLGGFDLVIGSSPCNTLAGGNRWHRKGLAGDYPSLFFDYYRVLEDVRLFMNCNDN